MSDTIVYLRDATLTRQGVLEDYEKLLCRLRWADASSWVLDVSVDSDATDLLQTPGSGIIVVHKGETVLSGDVEDWSETLDGDDLRLSFNGYDDTFRTAGRVLLPAANPATAATGYDTRSGPCETVVKGYVGANLAAGAAGGRADPQITVAADTGRGLAVPYQGRFETLLEALQVIALRGGDWGFQIVQNDARQLVFDVQPPRDVSSTALFSRDLGNLAGYVLQRTRTTGNLAYVGGQGELAARTIVVRTLAADDGDVTRREVFLDQRQTDDPMELAQAGDEELVKRRTAATLKMTALDTDGLSFLRDYRLGDLVSAQGFYAVLREIDLTVDGDGVLVEPLVGDPGAVDPKNGLQQFAARRRTASRVSNLERR